MLDNSREESDEIQNNENTTNEQENLRDVHDFFDSWHQQQDVQLIFQSNQLQSTSTDSTIEFEQVDRKKNSKSKKFLQV